MFKKSERMRAIKGRMEEIMKFRKYQNKIKNISLLTEVMERRKY
jgi:hypothetical protein